MKTYLEYFFFLQKKFQTSYGNEVQIEHKNEEFSSLLGCSQ